MTLMLDRIMKKVNEITDFYHTCDPFELCEEMGIIVVALNLPDSVNGIYTILHEQNTIIINSALPYDKRKVICAHELGHVMLHNGLNRMYLERGTNYCIDAFETEADTFAACLLIDDKKVRSLTQGCTVCVADIAAMAKVPEQYVKLRYQI